ncbi:T-cell surface antigen CD2-like [Hippocampus zosterae]|uniref:T-cell surface antigen CD2-like n=1 Tax=Hippocampus zosterae TaxID=109293 RepID=UPI00223CCEC9|nr:T-cell surface antigen CD2-like [Hippocampus zosterae]
MKMTVMVQMVALSIVSVLLLCCCLTSADSQDGCDAYAPVGGRFAVPLHHKLQKSENLRWRHNKTKIFDQRPDRMVIGKRDDVFQNGSLKLTNLARSSEGIYVPEVYDEKGKHVIGPRSLYLCVLDPVSKPGLKMECALPDVKFTCVPGQMPEVTVKWFQNDKLLPQKNKRTVVQVAQKVVDDSFTCEVSNHVSSMSSEGVIQNCTGSSSSIFPKELFGLDFRIMVSILAGMGGLALLLFIILIVCCIRAMREKQKQVQEEEELRLGWTNPEGQHQQCHHPPNPHHHSHGQPGRGRRGEPPRGQAQGSPRRPTQDLRSTNTQQQAPPLPQPRKKVAAQRI